MRSIALSMHLAAFVVLAAIVEYCFLNCQANDNMDLPNLHNANRPPYANFPNPSPNMTN
jgi:hypothetical protein